MLLIPLYYEKLAIVPLNESLNVLIDFLAGLHSVIVGSHFGASIQTFRITIFMHKLPQCRLLVPNQIIRQGPQMFILSFAVTVVLRQVHEHQGIDEAAIRYNIPQMMS